MKKIIILIILACFALTSLFCNKDSKKPFITSFSLNGSEVKLTEKDYRYLNETIYLSFSTLEKNMYLEIKELAPGKQIGMCSDDNCIPFDLDKNDKEAAFKEGEEYFIPVIPLMEMLGSPAKWDDKNKKLEITYGT